MNFTPAKAGREPATMSEANIVILYSRPQQFKDCAKGGSTLLCEGHFTLSAYDSIAKVCERVSRLISYEDDEVCANISIAANYEDIIAITRTSAVHLHWAGLEGVYFGPSFGSLVRQEMTKLISELVLEKRLEKEKLRLLLEREANDVRDKELAELARLKLKYETGVS